jgi:glucan 1,3-beta-glucosidase
VTTPPYIILTRKPIIMRISVSTTLVAFVAGASAAGRLGFALGVKHSDGSCKITGDYEADLDAIQSNAGSTTVRIFDASECDVVAQILPAVKSKNFGVVLGVWYVLYSRPASGRKSKISRF